MNSTSRSSKAGVSPPKLSARDHVPGPKVDDVIINLCAEPAECQTVKYRIARLENLVENTLHLQLWQVVHGRFLSLAFFDQVY